MRRLPPSQQDVIAVTSGQRAPARFAIEPVVAAFSIKYIIAEATRQRIAAVSAAEDRCLRERLLRFYRRSQAPQNSDFAEESVIRKSNRIPPFLNSAITEPLISKYVSAARLIAGQRI